MALQTPANAPSSRNRAAWSGTGHGELLSLFPDSDGLHRSCPLEAVPGVKTLCVVIAFCHPQTDFGKVTLVRPCQYGEHKKITHSAPPRAGTHPHAYQFGGVQTGGDDGDQAACPVINLGDEGIARSEPFLPGLLRERPLAAERGAERRRSIGKGGQAQRSVERPVLYIQEPHRAGRHMTNRASRPSPQATDFPTLKLGASQIVRPRATSGFAARPRAGPQPPSARQARHAVRCP